jgi:hypothetical protein
VEVNNLSFKEVSAKTTFKVGFFKPRKSAYSPPRGSREVINTIQPQFPSPPGYIGLGRPKLGKHREDTHMGLQA